MFYVKFAKKNLMIKYQKSDGTEDIYEGRKEFAEQVLGLIEKLERPRQQDQYNKLQAKAIAATNARTELSEKVGSTWAPGALKE